VLVDQGAAAKGLMRWVKLHPTNIAQKVQIIVEHFRVNVEDLLEGKAKAMVVTDSRIAAIRYKTAIDAYIKKMGYSEITTLVAFSGDREDPETGPGTFNERNMNPGLKGRDLREAFATNDYRVMLVANKFQTGFDQPLLVAMYVDRVLSGVAAVQTLSRLNRTHPGKELTFVLDFVNKGPDILEAFKPYYDEARLDATTDPNLIHDLQSKLDVQGRYTADEVEAVVQAWVAGAGNNALSAALSPVKKRFEAAYQAAVQFDDEAALAELDLFRKDIGTFVRLYDFLSQIINYGDTDLEKRSIFFRLLDRLLQPHQHADVLDLTGVTLKRIKQRKVGTTHLDLAGGESKALNPITGAGSREKRDPQLVLLEQVLARLNELFADEDFTEEQQRTWVEGLVSVLLSDEKLKLQAKNNTKEQFLSSPDLRDAVIFAVLGNQTSHNRMADIFHGDTQKEGVLVDALGELLHARTTEAA
jgi:type I restriction enzyme R subunit